MLTYAYDLWKTREPDWDAEAEAREEWETDLDIISVLGYDEVSDLIFCALSGTDVSKRVKDLMDKAWKKEIQDRIECSYDY